MMRLTRCALGLLACVGMLGASCVSEEEATLADGEPEIESSSAALSIYEANPLGNQSVLSPAEGPPITIAKTGAWITVPGLSTAVFSHRGDNLAIAVSAEMTGVATVWMRALVDGQPAAPSDVKFKIGAENFDGTRAFTFVAPGVSAGQHTVEIQWFVNPGNSISMRDRTLTVNSGSTFFGAGRLAVAAATSGPDVLKTTAIWEDMPGLATSITTAAAQPLLIGFSAEAFADKGRFMARALVDGAVVSDATFLSAGMNSRWGTRSFVFVAPTLPAGAHQVKIQWLADPGGRIRVGDRTLTAASAPSGDRAGLSQAASIQSPPVSFSGLVWADVPDLSLTVNALPENSTTSITTGGEAYVQGTGRLFLRVLVDDKPARPGDVTLIQGGPAMRAASHSFIVKNLRPGSHAIRVQARTDTGTTGFIRDRYVQVIARRRSGSDFAQSFDQMGFSPRQRSHQVMVLCLDPVRPGHAAPTLGQVRGHVQGDDGDLSLKAWFADNSGNRVTLDGFQYVNCGPFAPAPPAHQGTWYWDGQPNENRHAIAWQDAIRAADAQINFHALDLNGDNRLTGDEMAMIIVRPQAVPYGTLRGVSVAVDGNSTPMAFDFVDAYLSANTPARRHGVGLLAHESSHLLLNAVDMYGCPQSDPSTFNVMSNHVSATHLAPFEKLKTGFVTPDVVEINAWTTRTVPLAAVETSKEITIVYDGDREDREYFILENRWGAGDVYDQPLGNSLVVWHIIEDPAVANAFPPAGGGACHVFPKSIRLRTRLVSNGATHDLSWADGTAARIRLQLTTVPGQSTGVRITRLP
jgi:M6 family metalloprotease-like protein